MDDFPKCSVCQEQFTRKGPDPYLLPCLHAVCDTCVTFAADGVISCSTCLREVDLTVTCLQKDAVRRKKIFHLTAKYRPTELLCTYDDDGNLAVCWCENCDELLCEYCQNMHSNFKATRSHVVQSCGNLEPTVSTVPKFCSIHKYDQLYLFDKGCKKLICARCRFEDHADHEVENVDAAADTVTKQLECHKNELLKLQAYYQSYMQNIRQDTEGPDKTHNSLKRNIRQIFQSLKSNLDQRKKELLIDLATITKETKAAQQTLLIACEENKKTCTSVLDYINNVFLFASKSEILDLETYVGEMTRTCLDAAALQTYTSTPSTAVFNTNSLPKLKAHVSGFGAILTIDTDGKSEINTDMGTQTDDDPIAEMEMKHKLDTEELKTKIDSEEKHIESLSKLTDQLNTEIKGLKMRIDVKETIEKRDAKRIDFLLDVARECGVHLLKPGVVDRSFMLKCTPLKYDKNRVNLDYVHINTKGNTDNRKSAPRFAGKRRLKKYKGTCSTEPLPQDGCLQYWEVDNRVSLDNPLSETWLILEVGVCREEQSDVSHGIGRRPYSYCMNVAHCPTHGGICRQIWKEGEHVLCLSDTLPNTAGASHTLHYGVVYDDARKKIVFLDVKEKKVISTLNSVDSSEPLWPMFGVYNPEWIAVSMKLVVGSDINMTEEKKAMIVKALSGW